MNWKLIVQLSLFGLVMAIATVYVIPTNVEPFLWLPIFLLCAYIIARQCRSRHFLHGFFVSIFNCVWVTTIHIALSGAYLEHHPAEARQMASMPIPLPFMMAMFGAMVGVVSGLVLGLFAFIASRLVKPR